MKRHGRKRVCLLAVAFFLLLCACNKEGSNEEKQDTNLDGQKETSFVEEESQDMTADPPVPGSDAEVKRIAFTFDDGPHPKYTEYLLDGLKARGVHATFFVIGLSAEKYPELIKRIQEEGHLIGNHTYSHVQLNRMSMEKACEEVIKLNTLIEELTGEQPIFIRPPFGEWDHKKECPAEMLALYWNIDPKDWTQKNADVVAARIVKQAKDGGIVLLHDNYKSSVEAALKAIDMLKEQGYVFVTADEMVLN